MRSVMRGQPRPQVHIPRSSFNRSHGLKTTFNAGVIVPIYVDEALPGDTFRLRMSAFARMSTPLYPVMDNIALDTFFFFVPNRLLWDNWQKFCGEQVNPGDSIDYTIPQVTVAASTSEMGLYDYLGVPPNLSNAITVNNLHGRAYNAVYNEWFRDENLQNSITVDTDDGPDTKSNYVLRIRGKRPDYFTSCLPWPQKGDAVDIPLAGYAPVTGIGLESPAGSTASKTIYETDASSSRSVTGWTVEDTGDTINTGDTYLALEQDSTNTGYPNIKAQLGSAVDGSTIDQLYQAMQIQKMLWKDANAGTRYTEIVRSHFGVISPDQRLQRPEYLGGGRSYVNINPVAQTSETNTTNLGSLGAFATAGINNHGFTKSFTEHGVILGLMCATADLTYQQGLDRMHSRQTRYDYYWPTLANIGEQAVLNKEIYADGSANDDAVFGYQERYSEYRHKQSWITGKFRSSASSSLDGWHLSEEFGSLPSLNSSFITNTVPMSRIEATPTEPDFIMDAYFDLKCARPMPVFGIPGMLGRF